MFNFITRMKPFICLCFTVLWGNYSIGDAISIEDQEVEHEVCYGEYPNEVYKIGDANYLINGGHKQITVMKLSASW